MMALNKVATLTLIVVKMVKSNKNLYALLPLVTGYITNSLDCISSVKKVISDILIITVTILFCLINIIGYFGCLYLIKDTDLEKKRFIVF